jgi:hypothetical protein
MSGEPKSYRRPILGWLAVAAFLCIVHAGSASADNVMRVGMTAADSSRHVVSRELHDTSEDYFKSANGRSDTQETCGRRRKACHWH